MVALFAEQPELTLAAGECAERGPWGRRLGLSGDWTLLVLIFESMARRREREAEVEAGNEQTEVISIKCYKPGVGKNAMRTMHETRWGSAGVGRMRPGLRHRIATAAKWQKCLGCIGRTL